MIKKHLITCSVICALAFISGLFICGKTDNTKSKKHKAEYKFIYPKDDPSTEFSFADEAVPLNDKSINRKMRGSLRKSSYTNIQSYILHKEATQLFPVIEPILAAYGIPDDFKYVPLVEAGLRDGVSKTGAAGWWQFMPGTARTYGLKVGNGRDERYNVRKSTIAACKYIKELYGEFNSWTLAAAAYNNGEIKLARAIRNQSEDNYFRLHLNSETGHYIYNIIAMKQVIERPELYGYQRYKVAYNTQPTELVALN